MCSHYKYQKIADKVDHYQIDNNNSKFFSKNVDWVVTEKVHGSNFCVYYRDGQINFGKRNSLLKEDDWFYNYQLIQEKLTQNIRQLSQIINHSQIVVYGELFGGWYPSHHQWTGPVGTRINQKGVSLIPFEERAVQEGIYYSPHLEFMVFDVAIIEQDKLQFMNFFQMEKYLKQTDFFYTKALLIGNFQAVQKYDLNFDSHIPSQLGLSSLPMNTNIAEGVVIKPVEPVFIKDKKGNEVRCLVKKKHPKFQEISDDFSLSDAQKSYEFIFLKLVNQNRLQAVVSKMGRITPDNKDVIIQSLIEDTWTDFYTYYSQIQIVDETKANDYLKKLCQTLIKHNL